MRNWETKLIHSTVLNHPNERGNEMKTEELKMLVNICLESNLTFYEFTKELRYHYELGLKESFHIVKETIKQLAQEDNYLAIAFCYQNQITYTISEGE